MTMPSMPARTFARSIAWSMFAAVSAVARRLCGFGNAVGVDRSGRVDRSGHHVVALTNTDVVDKFGWVAWFEHPEDEHTRLADSEGCTDSVSQCRSGFWVVRTVEDDRGFGGNDLGPSWKSELAKSFCYHIIGYRGVEKLFRCRERQ